MLKKLLDLFLGSNSTNRAEIPGPGSDRKSLGQQNVGIPQSQFFADFMSAVDQRTHGQVNHDVLKYYMEGMFFSHVLSMIDKGLSDEELARLPGDEVKFLHIVLMRDFIRHNVECICAGGDRDWIEPMFASLLQPLAISAERKSAFPEEFELDDLGAQWAVELSEPFNFAPHRLAVTHAAIVNGPADEGLC